MWGKTSGKGHANKEKEELEKRRRKNIRRNK
jgi:hypothetical protein